MSGIAGVFYRDGRVVPADTLAVMLTALAHRGPDGAFAWQAGAVGLGQRQRGITPEAAWERPPLVRGDGQLVLVADARIDNRVELLTALPDMPTPQPPTDADLILAAYEKWGEVCPAKLIGDYAFVIWDGRYQRLFCARDHYGVRPFYYYQSSHLFAFASEAKALFCLPDVPRRLNELRIGQHLAMDVGDNAQTFYQEVQRLLPAHTLTVSWEQGQMRRYWSLDPQREIQLASDEEYAAAFGEVFTEAVRCRLRTAGPIGSMLSGGLDSSAVTCVAGKLLQAAGRPSLVTVTAVYGGLPECDESAFTNAVLATGHLQPYQVDMMTVSPLADWAQVQWHGDEPVTSPTTYIPWRLNRLAAAQGVGVLLDGVDGDSAVSHGHGLLAELAWAGQWARFAQEARATGQHDNLPSAPALLGAYGTPYLEALADGWRWWQFGREVRQIRRYFAVSGWNLWRRYGLRRVLPRAVVAGWQRWQKRPSAWEEATAIIRPEFARQINLHHYLDTEIVSFKSSREEHYYALNLNMHPYGLELADRTGNAFGIESRHPFADRRLLEFCLALPAEQKLFQGWTRVVLRRALQGILPPLVQWRGGKTINKAAFTGSLRRFERERLEAVVYGADGRCLEPYVDLAALRRVYGRYLAQPQRDDEMLVWHALTLSFWLNQLSGR